MTLPLDENDNLYLPPPHSSQVQPSIQTLPPISHILSIASAGASSSSLAPASAAASNGRSTALSPVSAAVLARRQNHQQQAGATKTHARTGSLHRVTSLPSISTTFLSHQKDLPHYSLHQPKSATYPSSTSFPGSHPYSASSTGSSSSSQLWDRLESDPIEPDSMVPGMGPHGATFVSPDKKIANVRMEDILGSNKKKGLAASVNGRSPLMARSLTAPSSNSLFASSGKAKRADKASTTSGASSTPASASARASKPKKKRTYSYANSSARDNILRARALEAQSSTTPTTPSSNQPHEAEERVRLVEGLSNRYQDYPFGACQAQAEGQSSPTSANEYSAAPSSSGAASAATTAASVNGTSFKRMKVSGCSSSVRGTTRDERDRQPSSVGSPSTSSRALSSEPDLTFSTEYNEDSRSSISGADDSRILSVTMDIDPKRGGSANRDGIDTDTTDYDTDVEMDGPPIRRPLKNNASLVSVDSGTSQTPSLTFSTTSSKTSTAANALPAIETTTTATATATAAAAAAMKGKKNLSKKERALLSDMERDCAAVLLGLGTGA